jgi:hypothetical protein
MNTNSIDSLWNHHVTPFSPVGEGKLLEECDVEQIKDKSSCTVLVRNARGVEWTPIDELDNLFSLPYKFIFLVQIPVQLLPNTAQDQVSFELVRHHDEQVIRDGISNALSSKYTKDQYHHLIFKVHFTTSSYFHNRSTFTVRMYDSYSNEQLFVSMPKNIFARKERSRRSEKLGKRKRLD